MTLTSCYAGCEMALSEDQRRELDELQKRLFGWSDEDLARRKAQDAHVPYVSPDPPPESELDEIDWQYLERRRQGLL